MEQDQKLSSVLDADTTGLQPNVICTETHTNRLVRIERRNLNGFYECRDVFLDTPLLFYRSNLIPMPTIPAKYKQHQFAQVAEHLGSALRKFPDAIRVDPHPLAVDTLARKLREAVIAKSQYAWKHPAVDENLWHEHSQELVVAIDTRTEPATILIGSRDAIRNKSKTAGSETVLTLAQSAAFELVKPSASELESICLFLHHRKLNPKPIVTVRGLTPSDVESIEQRYDIAVVPDENDPTVFQLLT